MRNFCRFGKIVCISVGFVRENNMERSIRLKSFYHDDENLLIQFKKLLEEHYNAPFHVLVDTMQKNLIFLIYAEGCLLMECLFQTF